MLIRGIALAFFILYLKIVLISKYSEFNVLYGSNIDYRFIFHFDEETRQIFSNLN